MLIYVIRGFIHSPWENNLDIFLKYFIPAFFTYSDRDLTIHSTFVMLGFM
jgi:hypothetical protein